MDMGRIWTWEQYGHENNMDMKTIWTWEQYGHGNNMDMRIMHGNSSIQMVYSRKGLLSRLLNSSISDRI